MKKAVFTENGITQLIFLHSDELFISASLAQKSGLSGYVPFVTRALKRKNSWKDTKSAYDYMHGKGPFRMWKNEFLTEYLNDGLKEAEPGTVQLSCDPAWEGRCLAMAPYDIWQYVGKVKIPTLVLYGNLSGTFLPSVVNKIRDFIPHAEIFEFKKTGHFVPMERPAETSQRILDFLQRHDY